MAEPQEFTCLAQRIAANNPDITSLGNFAFAPLAEALAKIGIGATKPKVLAVLSQNASRTVHTGLAVHDQVGDIINTPKVAANDEQFQQVA